MCLPGCWSSQAAMPHGACLFSGVRHSALQQRHLEEKSGFWKAGKESQAGMVARQLTFLPALCHLQACEMAATCLHFVFTSQPGTRKMKGNAFLLLKLGFSFKEEFLPRLG
ncbi:hypothetical protein LEMLEM_LOCUS3445, partial [Lemmus lemmus]